MFGKGKNEQFEKLANELTSQLNDIKTKLIEMSLQQSVILARTARVEGEVEALSTALMQAVKKAVSEEEKRILQEMEQELAKLKSERELFEAYRTTIQDYARFREVVEGELTRLKAKIESMERGQEGSR